MKKDVTTPLRLPLTAEDMEVGLKVAQVGLGTVDYRADTLRCDALAAEFFGLPVGEDVPRADLHARIHPEDWPKVERGVECLLSPSDPLEVLDMTHRIEVPDGPVRWVNARKQVTYDAQGAPVSGVFAVVDITARVLAEHRAQYLIGELNHRGKNLIAVVQGMVRQLERHSKPEELGEKLLARLTALGRNQDAILEDRGSRFVLRDVFSEQIRPFDGAAMARVSLSGPDMMVSSHAAQILSMVVHELATNAAKYGALSVEGGRVEITWSVAEGEAHEFALFWQERGGPPVTGTGGSGFGTQVLTKLTEASLGAETQVTFDEAGLRFALRAPLERLSGD